MLIPQDNAIKKKIYMDIENKEMNERKNIKKYIKIGPCDSFQPSQCPYNEFATS